MTGTLDLIVRRTIRSTPARLFAAWTESAQLLQWWGPDEVRCAEAEIDLKVGGRYRIANRMPDGSLLWILGAFEEITAPERLVYSWRTEPGTGAVERVTVRFEARAAATEVIVIHERITDAALRDRHAAGWAGCLDGLARYAAP